MKLTPFVVSAVLAALAAACVLVAALAVGGWPAAVLVLGVELGYAAWLVSHAEPEEQAADVPRGTFEDDRAAQAARQAQAQPLHTPANIVRPSANIVRPQNLKGGRRGA